MKICFWVCTRHGQAILDPDYCEQKPLGGSETAAVKMVQSLCKRGVDACIITKPQELASLTCDIFISLRDWRIFADGSRPGRFNYLWCQDDIDQPMVKDLEAPDVAAKVYAACDGVILISHYQAYRWLAKLHVPTAKVFLSSNGIDLPRFQANADALGLRPKHAYYASTPFRGLDALLDLWPTVRQAIGPEAALTICSSLKVYAEAEQAPYETLYEKARQTEGVRYLGSVGQARIREVAAASRALAYPCIFPETGCIVAMEAMASGCVVVGTALGALPETAWRNPLVPFFDGWADIWLEELIRVLVDDDYYIQRAKANLHQAQLMGWDDIALRWLMRFRADEVKRAAP